MFRHLAQDRARGESRELGGLTIASAGASFQMFNAAFFNSPITDLTDLDLRIALAKVAFTARGLDWSFWVCEELVSEPLRKKLARSCERVGLHLSSEMPAMVAERLLGPSSGNPELEIRRVDSAGTLRDFCRIGASCFQVPLDWFEEVFDRAERITAAMSGWVGYCDGKAVCTVATMQSAGAVGVYNLATLVPFRERGFGETMLRHAVRESFSLAGEKPVVLQSTRCGLRLYQRLGFRRVGRILVFPSR